VPDGTACGTVHPRTPDQQGRCAHPIPPRHGATPGLQHLSLRNAFGKNFSTKWAARALSRAVPPPLARAVARSIAQHGGGARLLPLSPPNPQPPGICPVMMPAGDVRRSRRVRRHTIRYLESDVPVRPKEPWPLAHETPAPSPALLVQEGGPVPEWDRASARISGTTPPAEDRPQLEHSAMNPPTAGMHPWGSPIMRLRVESPPNWTS
jgi:hypothetical protein